MCILLIYLPPVILDSSGTGILVSLVPSLQSLELCLVYRRVAISLFFVVAEQNSNVLLEVSSFVLRSSDCFSSSRASGGVLLYPQRGPARGYWPASPVILVLKLLSWQYRLAKATLQNEKETIEEVRLSLLRSRSRVSVVT